MINDPPLKNNIKLPTLRRYLSGTNSDTYTKLTYIFPGRVSPNKKNRKIDRLRLVESINPRWIGIAATELTNTGNLLPYKSPRRVTKSPDAIAPPKYIEPSKAILKGFSQVRFN